MKRFRRAVRRELSYYDFGLVDLVHIGAIIALGILTAGVYAGAA